MLVPAGIRFDRLPLFSWSGHFPHMAEVVIGGLSFIAGATIWFLFAREDRERQREILKSGTPVSGRLANRDDLYLTYMFSGKEIEVILPRSSKIFLSMGARTDNPVLVFVNQAEPEDCVLYNAAWYSVVGLQQHSNKPQAAPNA